MTYTSTLQELNEPGFCVKQIVLTLDGEEIISNYEYTNPEYVEAREINIHQRTQATDGSMVRCLADVDPAEAQVDFTFDVSAGGDTTGAVFVVTLKFPTGTGADQDGTSIYGAGNTGVIF